MTDLRAARRPWVLMFIAVALVAANMRMTITGVGPLLEQIAADQGVPTAALGALGSVPLLAWALFSPVAHWLSARIGMSQAVTVSLIVLIGGTVWRSLPGGATNLWLGTALIGVGLSVANVLMPAVIKRDFPQRVALVMGAYTALLGGMGALVAGIVVPVSHLPLGDGEFGWRLTLLLTGITLPIAIVVWVWANAARTPHQSETETVLGPPTPAGADPAATTTDATPVRLAAASKAGRRIWKDPTAWLVSVYMGAQSVTFYIMSTWLAPYETSLGLSPVAAGVDLMIYQFFGVAGSLLLPVFGRGRLKRWMPATLPTIGLVSWIGMALLPAAMPAWIVIGGMISGALLTMSLTLMAQRARTQEHASALSGMAQSLGYAIAAFGPVTFGWLYGLTGGWVLPFTVVWVAAIVVILVGLALRRPRFVLDARD